MKRYLLFGVFLLGILLPVVYSTDVVFIKVGNSKIVPVGNGEPLQYHIEYMIKNTADYAVPLDSEQFQLPEYVSTIERVTFCGEVLDDTQYVYNSTSHVLKLVGVSIGPSKECKLEVDAKTVPPMYSSVTIRPAGDSYEMIVSLSSYTTKNYRYLPIVIPKDTIHCTISSVSPKEPESKNWYVKLYETDKYYIILIDRGHTSSSYYILKVQPREGVCVFKNERIYLHEFSNVGGYYQEGFSYWMDIPKYPVSKNIGDVLNATYAVPEPFTSPDTVVEVKTEYPEGTGIYKYDSIVEPSIYYMVTFRDSLEKVCPIRINRTEFLHETVLTETSAENITNMSKSGTIYVGTMDIEKKTYNVSLIDTQSKGIYDTLCFDTNNDGVYDQNDVCVPIKSVGSYRSIKDEVVLDDKLGISSNFIYRLYHYERSGNHAIVRYFKVPKAIADSSDVTWKGVVERIECTIYKNGKSYSDVFLSVSDHKTILLAKKDPERGYYVDDKIVAGEVFRVYEKGRLYYKYDYDKSTINTDASELGEGSSAGDIHFSYYHEATDGTLYKVLYRVDNAYVPPYEKTHYWGVKHTIFIAYDSSKGAVVLDYMTSGDTELLLNQGEYRIIKDGTNGLVPYNANRVYFVLLKYDPEEGEGAYAYIEVHPQYVMAQLDINMVIDYVSEYKYYEYSLKEQAMYVVYTEKLIASDAPALFTKELVFPEGAWIVDYTSEGTEEVRLYRATNKYVLKVYLMKTKEPVYVHLVVKEPANFVIKATKPRTCNNVGNEEICEEEYSVINNEGSTVELRILKTRDRGEIVTSIYLDNVQYYDYKVNYTYDSAGQPIYILYLNISPGSHTLKIITKRLPELVQPTVVTKVIIDDNTPVVRTEAKIVNLYSEVIPAARIFIPTPCTPVKVYYITPSGILDITNESYVYLKSNGVELTVDLYPGKEYEYSILCSTTKVEVQQLTDDTKADENKIYTDEKEIKSNLDSVAQVEVIFKAPTLYPESVKYYVVYMKKNDTYFKLPENVTVILGVDGIRVRYLVLDKGEKIIIGAKWSYSTPIELKTDVSKFLVKEYEDSKKYVEEVRKNYTYAELPDDIRSVLDELSELEKNITEIISKQLLYYHEAEVLRELSEKYVIKAMELKSLLEKYLQELQEKQKLYDELLQKIDQLKPLISTIQQAIEEKLQKAVLEQDINTLKEFKQKLEEIQNKVENLKSVDLRTIDKKELEKRMQEVDNIKEELEVLLNKVTSYQIVPKEVIDQAKVLQETIEKLVQNYENTITELYSKLDQITHPKLVDKKDKIEKVLESIRQKIEDLKKLETQLQDVRTMEDVNAIQQQITTIQNDMETQISSVRRQINSLLTQQRILQRQQQQKQQTTQPPVQKTKEKEEKKPPVLLILVGVLGAIGGLLFFLYKKGKIKVKLPLPKKEKPEKPEEKEVSTETPESPVEGIEELEELKKEETKKVEVAPGVEVPKEVVESTEKKEEKPEEKIEKIVEEAIEEIRKAAGEET